MKDNAKEDSHSEKLILEKKAKIVRSNCADLIDLILQQMEVTRNQHGYTKGEFGRMLGFPDTYYSKLTTKVRDSFYVTNFITYCRLFGLDISRLVRRSYLDTADSVLQETAVFLARLEPDTLDSINEAISQSKESASNKKQADLLISHLKTISNKPAPFYAADIPDDIEDGTNP